MKIKFLLDEKVDPFFSLQGILTQVFLPPVPERNLASELELQDYQSLIKRRTPGLLLVQTSRRKG